MKELARGRVSGAKKDYVSLAIVTSKDDYDSYLKQLPINPVVLIERFNYPVSYPCKVSFESIKVEVDDVGFGYFYDDRLEFVYVKDIESKIEGLSGILREMRETI